MRRKNKKKTKSTFLDPDITPSQGFFSRETDFHLCQFLSNFLGYSSSNFPSSYLYSNFTIYLPSNSLSSTISVLSYLLTSAFIHSLNSSNAFFAFSKFSFFSHMSCFAVNPFHCTKYLSTPLIFLLFNIFSTFYS